MSRREYSIALLTGAVGAGLILLAVRQQWARAVFTQPKPLPAQVVGVSGADLVPLAAALAVAALACLAAVIATRGAWRRAAGVLLALLGAGAGVAVTTAVTAASVVSVAASHVGSPESAAVSGAAGSTTSGTTGGSASVVTTAGSAGHAIMTGTPWRVAVIAGALLVFAAGLATVTRGADWPVMSARYELPGRRGPAGAGTGAGDTADAPGGTSGAPGRAGDSASMWESLSVGEDPTGTEDPLSVE
ncbi:MAG TPA: Trp biosynthesis-associated membrane protein [Trebonia sp.]